MDKEELKGLKAALIFIGIGLLAIILIEIIHYQL